MLPILTAVGNLKYIETKYTQSGKALTSFTLNCSEKDSKGEWQNLNIKGEVWEKSSEFVSKYFKDGSPAIITGKVITDSYQKQDGTKVYTNKFLFPKVDFVPSKPQSNNTQTNQSPNQGYQQPNNQGYAQSNQTNQHPNPTVEVMPPMDEDMSIPF